MKLCVMTDECIGFQIGDHAFEDSDSYMDEDMIEVKEGEYLC